MVFGALSDRVRAIEAAFARLLGHAMKDPKAALVPWLELAGRDPGDAAVLEARIAQVERELANAARHSPACTLLLSVTATPIGTKRLILDTNYYETYNLPHVKLVNIRKRFDATVALHPSMAEELVLLK